MREKILQLIDKYYFLKEQLNVSDVVSDLKRLKEINQELKSLSEVVAVGERYIKAQTDLSAARELADAKDTDSDIKELAYEEINVLHPQIERYEEELKILLIPRDPNDYKNCIMEIRAGTGGEEAGIFAGDLFRMYNRFADIQG